MVARENTWLGMLDTELEQLVDCRILDRDTVKVLAMYNLYLVNLLADRGIEYRGESVRQGDAMTLLVVKVTLEGSPLVCFVSARTPYDCQRIFLRQLEEGTVAWRDDKFA